MDNHYLPQFLTRRWADGSGKVLRYRRVPSGQVTARRVSPKATGFEPDLYATPPAGPLENQAPHVIEKEFFSSIDNDAALVLDKLVSLAPLAEHERTAWALFVNSMGLRHRDDILERDARAPALAAAVKANWAARTSDPEGSSRIQEALSDIDIEQVARTAHRTVMVQKIRDARALDALKALAWNVMAIHPEVPLITTDRPVLVNLGQQRTPIELLTMPLSPTRLFVAFPSQWRKPDGTYVDGVEELTENLAFAHDLLILNEQRCRFVYTTRKLEATLTDGRVLRMEVAVEAALRRWPA